MENIHNSFSSVWIAPSIILGLGIARLLTNFIVVFKSRNNAVLDWVPMTWASCIFIWQVQYLWAVIELPAIIKTWTLFEFLLLISLSMLLFIASALVLPDSGQQAGESLTDYFRQDGRWALLALTGWGIDAIFVNWYLFGLPFITEMTGLLSAIVVLPVLFLWTSSRHIREVITVINVVLTVWLAWYLSPESY